jgi:hypothetical protein
VCASCGKARSVSNWSYTVAGRERSTGTKVRARAEQIAARAKTDFNEQGVRALVIPKVIPTLAAFAPTFLAYVEAAQTLRPKTKLSYQNGWRLLSKTKLAGMRLTAIGTADADVVTFPGSGSNANQALRTLSRMLSHACSVDILKARPSSTCGMSASATRPLICGWRICCWSRPRLRSEVQSFSA